MNSFALAFILGVSLSLITVLGDALIKQASLGKGFTGWHFLLIGAIIYGSTALGWFFVMRKMKLSTIGVLYAVSVVVFLTLVSVLYFKEKISAVEIVGIGMAICSLVLLARFA